MSLRTKQALILLLATVVPFALGGAAMNLAVVPAYRRAVAHAAEEQTQRLAEHGAANLAREVARLERLASWRELRARVEASPGSVAAGGPDVVRDELSWWRDTDPGVLELAVTDASGRLVTSTSRPRSASEAGEPLWRAAYDGGSGRTVVADPHRGAEERWTLQVAVPIHADGTTSTPARGVLAATLDLAEVFRDVRGADLSEGTRFLVVDRMGRAILDGGQGADGKEIETPRRFALRAMSSGNVIVGDPEERKLVAWSQLPLARMVDGPAVRTAHLYAVTERKTATVFGPIRTVQIWMICIGLLTTGLAVGVGYWLTDALVVRPIRTLAAGMRALSRGDFERATAIADQLAKGQ